MLNDKMGNDAFEVLNVVQLDHKPSGSFAKLLGSAEVRSGSFIIELLIERGKDGAVKVSFPRDHDGISTVSFFDADAADYLTDQILRHYFSLPSAYGD